MTVANFFVSRTRGMVVTARSIARCAQSLAQHRADFPPPADGRCVRMGQPVTAACPPPRETRFRTRWSPGRGCVRAIDLRVDGTDGILAAVRDCELIRRAAVRPPRSLGARENKRTRDRNASVEARVAYRGPLTVGLPSRYVSAPTTPPTIRKGNASKRIPIAGTIARYVLYPMTPEHRSAHRQRNARQRLR
jgi:hypothetical protein